MIAKHREVPDSLGPGAHECKRGGGRCSLESDGEEHDVPVGIGLGQLKCIRGGIHEADIGAAGFVFERAAASTRHAHHVAERGKDEIRLRGERQPIVDAAHRENANWASGAMNQFDIVRQQIFQSKSIDGVRVTAADFHDAVVPVAIGEAPDFFASLSDELGSAEFVDEFH